MARFTEETNGSVVLYDVPWDTYERLLSAFGDKRLPHTYSNGALEIMSPTQYHDWLKGFAGRLIEMAALTLDIPIKNIGSTTLRRQLKEKGLEPDECYYVENERRVRSKRKLDLKKDPPPDLAVEVEVSRKILDRLEAYSNLGVREIWRLDGKSVTFLKLTGGDYRSIKQSLAFPTISPDDIARFISLMEKKDENSIVRDFVAWIERDKRK
jgi:Uma2 family endonuclease